MASISYDLVVREVHGLVPSDGLIQMGMLNGDSVQAYCPEILKFQAYPKLGQYCAHPNRSLFMDRPASIQETVPLSHAVFTLKSRLEPSM